MSQGNQPDSHLSITVYDVKVVTTKRFPSLATYKQEANHHQFNCQSRVPYLYHVYDITMCPFHMETDGNYSVHLINLLIVQISAVALTRVTLAPYKPHNRDKGYVTDRRYQNR